MKRNRVNLQAKAKEHLVSQVAATRFQVWSGTSGDTHTLNYDTTAPLNWRCDCDFKTYNHDRVCSHQLALLREVTQAKVYVWPNLEQARKQHKKLIVNYTRKGELDLAITLTKV